MVYSKNIFDREYTAYQSLLGWKSNHSSTFYMNAIPTSQKQVILLIFILPSSPSFERTVLQTIHNIVIRMELVAIVVLDGMTTFNMFAPICFVW